SGEQVLKSSWADMCCALILAADSDPASGSGSSVSRLGNGFLVDNGTVFPGNGVFTDFEVEKLGRIRKGRTRGIFFWYSQPMRMRNAAGSSSSKVMMPSCASLYMPPVKAPLK